MAIVGGPYLSSYGGSATVPSGVTGATKMIAVCSGFYDEDSVVSLSGWTALAASQGSASGSNECVTRAFVADYAAGSYTPTFSGSGGDGTIIIYAVDDGDEALISTAPGGTGGGYAFSVDLDTLSPELDAVAVGWVTTWGNGNAADITDPSNVSAFSKAAGTIYETALWTADVTSAGSTGQHYAYRGQGDTGAGGWLFWQTAPGVGGYDGTGSSSLDAETVSASGGMSLDGSSSASVDAETVNSSGAMLLDGSSASSLDPETAGATVVLSMSAASASLLDTETSDGSGALELSGSAAPQTEPEALGSGSESLAGVSDASLDPEVVSASGDDVGSAAGAASLDPETATASGAMSLSGSSASACDTETVAGIGDTGSGDLSGAAVASLDAETTNALACLTIDSTLSAETDFDTSESFGEFSLIANGSAITSVSSLGDGDTGSVVENGPMRAAVTLIIPGISVSLSIGRIRCNPRAA